MSVCFGAIPDISNRLKSIGFFVIRYALFSLDFMYIINKLSSDRDINGIGHARVRPSRRKDGRIASPSAIRRGIPQSSVGLTKKVVP